MKMLDDTTTTTETAPSADKAVAAESKPEVSSPAAKKSTSKSKKAAQSAPAAKKEAKVKKATKKAKSAKGAKKSAKKTVKRASNGGVRNGDAKFTLPKENPFKPGTRRHKEYALGQKAGTVAKFVASGGDRPYLSWFMRAHGGKWAAA